jgi:hypothetical protein
LDRPTPEQRLETLAAPVRTAVAGVAVAVALLLLFRIPLIASFRAALIGLAAIELLSFGAAAVSRNIGVRDALAIAMKLLVLAAAYLALAQ